MWDKGSRQDRVDNLQDDSSGIRIKGIVEKPVLTAVEKEETQCG